MEDLPDEDEAAPVELPITGELDLHAFAPRDVLAVVDEYLRAASERGLRDVRLIHGKGTGAQRRAVHALLAKHGCVESYRSADERAGGWGATLVQLR